MLSEPRMDMKLEI